MIMALTISDSDPTGGGGIQADLKTFACFKVHGVAAISSLTIQNTRGIQEVVKIPSDLLRKQLATLLDDVRVDAVKTGSLLDRETIEIVSEFVTKYDLRRYVLDPVIRSSTGYWILKKEDLDFLRKTLLPRAWMITPNLHDAEVLVGWPIENEKEMKKAALEIKAMGPRYVLIKGGHLEGPAVDLLIGGGRPAQAFRKPRIRDRHLQGAGCVLSAAITAGLAQGLSAESSVRKAKAFVHAAIQSAIAIGHGRQLLNLRSI